MTCARLATSSTHGSGSAPYPTVSPRQSMASAAPTQSARTARRASRFPWMSDRIAYRTSGPASGGGGTMFAQDAVQHAVDEPARLRCPELLGDLDRLVDGGLRRHLGLPEQLVHRHAQDVAIDHGHAVEVPVLGVLGQERVDLALLLFAAAHQGFGEGLGLGIDRAPLPELALVRHRILGRVQIELVEELQGHLSRLSPASHDDYLRRGRLRGVTPPGGAGRGPPCPRCRSPAVLSSPCCCTNAAISIAASAASCPRLPTSPPARAHACSSVSAVTKPKVAGTPVSSATRWMPAAACPATKSKCGVSPLITQPTQMIPA